MRFDKIVISNYRQYESLFLDFPQNLPTDLHVVVASNGVGKTNLLNAIDWCLYGDESHLGDSSESLSICNLSAIDSAKRAGQKEALVSVKIFATEQSEQIVFERTVAVNPNTYVLGISRFQVTRTPDIGNTGIFVNEQASEIVNIFLPKKIKQYFFFDGEQLYNYFGKSQDSRHVKDSIHEIAQITVVTHVREHLEQTINEKQREINKFNPEAEQLQRDLDDAKKQKDRLCNDIVSLDTANADAQDTIDDLTGKIAGMEQVAEDDRNYKFIRERIERLKKDKADQQHKLEAFVREYFVYLALYEVNASTSAYIADKESRGHLPPDINRDLLIQSLRDHKCAVCSQEITNDIEQHLSELMTKFEVSSAVSNKLMEIKNDINRACNKAKNYVATRDTIYAASRSIDTEIETLEAEAEHLYQKISSCSSVEDIQQWMKQREEMRSLMRKNSEKKGTYLTQIKELDKKIGLKSAQLESATKGEQRCAEIKKQLSFFKKALQIVREIEDEVITDVRTRMEKETFDIFSNLIWKSNTYGRISLSEDYRLRLFHVHGDSCLGSCSAAERELLALAFTLALHRVSHHDSLLFIDTPVGRVSDENRECFARSLISVSENKQLILAFTPSEYSVEISKYFDGNASSFNRLGSPDENSTVRIGGNTNG